MVWYLMSMVLLNEKVNIRVTIEKSTSISCSSSILLLSTKPTDYSLTIKNWISFEMSIINCSSKKII